MGFAVSRILACAALALIAPLSVQAQISDDVVKIGVLTDLSGPASTPTGTGSVLAAQMAVDDSVAALQVSRSPSFRRITRSNLMLERPLRGAGTTSSRLT